MVRYIGPKIKIIRRLGILPGLTRKIIKLRKFSPGEHGKKIILTPKRSSLSGDYRERLFEKQKLRFNYGITEKQLFAYYEHAKNSKQATGKTILQLLESRFDCILYRLGFAPTIPAARQLINHRHILVNGKIVSIPSFFCKIGDIFSVKNTVKSKNIIQNYLNQVQQKRKIIIERIKQLFTQKKIKDITQKLTINTLLPNHLFLDVENLQGEMLSDIKRRNLSLRVKELKVVEFYSR